MRYLLDTSVLLLAIREPARLSASARAAVTGANELFLSAASIWEIVIKRGPLGIPEASAWVRRHTEALGISLLAIRPQHVCASEGLPEYHKDPFDRLLVAQAIIEELPIITEDAWIRRYPVRTVW